MRRVRTIAYLALVFLAAFVAAAWGRESDPRPKAVVPRPVADGEALKPGAPRPEWARSEVAAGPPTPGRVLRSTRGAGAGRAKPSDPQIARARGGPVAVPSLTGTLARSAGELLRPAPLQDGDARGVFGRRFDAAGAPTTAEFQANTYTTSAQERPDVVADKKGNTVVVWTSNGQDGSGRGIFGRWFGPTAAPLGGEFPVNTYTTGEQIHAQVEIDKKGNALVVWLSDGQDGDDYGIFARKFDKSGAPIGAEFGVNTYTTGGQSSPTLAIDGKGNAVVAWTSGQDGSGSGIFARRFDPAGVPAGGEFAVNTYTTSSQATPSVAADKKGNAVVVWRSSDQDYGTSGIFGRWFDPSGAAGGEVAVNTYTTDSQLDPVVAVDKKGNAVVAWETGDQDGDSFGVFGRRFGPLGVPAGGEFGVTAFTTGAQDEPAVAVDKKGNAVVTWRGGGTQDGSGYGVFARRFDPSGVPLGGDIQVNTYTTGYQGSPRIAVDGKGRFVVVWNSG